jgi:putative Mg2+ transporter-C (MgtC) family protein
MISDGEIVLRLLLGALFGGIIGFERQHHGRPAGFRTHLLVCVASVLVMIVSEYFHFRAAFDPAYVRVDPGRIASGAITGIGFVGAGVIVKAGVNVHGLTTAACLWIVSAIGLALGTGLYQAAAASVIITLLTLWLLEKLERHMATRYYKLLTVVTDGESGSAEELAALVEKHGVAISKMDTELDRAEGRNTFELTLALREDKSLESLLRETASLPYVRKLSLRS